MPRNDGTMGFAIPLNMLPGLGGEEPEKPAQPVLAQVMDLLAAYDLSITPTAYAQGDLLQERQGMGFLAGNPPVLILMRIIDPRDKMARNAITLFAARIPLLRPDCFCAFKDTDGDLRLVAHEMWRLEPYTGERPA